MLRAVNGSKALILRPITCILAASSMPTPSIAETVCEKLPGYIEALEYTKKNLALGNYAAFFGFANRTANIDANPEISNNAPEDILSRAFPNGFQACSTIMSKRISERFVSEIVMLIDSQERVIFLAWDVVKINASWEVVKYQIEDNFQKIIAEWR